MKQKGFVLIPIIILVLISALGFFIYQNIQLRKNVVIQPSPIATTPTYTNPPTEISMVTKTVLIKHESAVLGSKTINMEIKIPQDWTFETIPQEVKSDYMIKNCSIYTMASKDGAIKLTLQPCQEGATKHSGWPSDAVISSQLHTSNNAGPFVKYRVRYMSSNNNYIYFDAGEYPDEQLDKSKAQIVDTITIGYSPPNESTDDFFFIPARLTLLYSGQSDTRNTYLSIADQIAASIFLR